MSDTTTRYPANVACEFDCCDLQKGDQYQYGCEFEFYIQDKFDFHETVEKIRQEISNISNIDILVDLVNLPEDADKNQCIQIKPDHSLEDHGVEISIPITSLDGVKYYLEKILPMIEVYGYTNEETGLHFHISTVDKAGANVNFYVYMLMCHDKKLLSSWDPRVGYSQNVMDVLLHHSKAATRTIKTKKGTIWNLEKIAPNHIEIKTMGGVDYHKQIDRIKRELDLYAECFDAVFHNRDTDYRKRLIKDHQNLIAGTDKEVFAEFSKAVAEAKLNDD